MLSRKKAMHILKRFVVCSCTTPRNQTEAKSMAQPAKLIWWSPKRTLDVDRAPCDRGRFRLGRGPYLSGKLWTVRQSGSEYTKSDMSTSQHPGIDYVLNRKKDVTKRLSRIWPMTARTNRGGVIWYKARQFWSILMEFSGTGQGSYGWTGWSNLGQVETVMAFFTGEDTS